jgi:thioredoxin reductase
VLLATAQHRRLNVPERPNWPARRGLLRHCDAPFFKDKRVVVSGAGNSAFTAALALLKEAAAETMVINAAGGRAMSCCWRRSPAHKQTLRDNHQVVKNEGEQKRHRMVLADRLTGAKKHSGDGVFDEIGLSPN